MIELRSSQGAALDKTRDMLRQGFRAGVIAAPCGFGKSVVACALIQSAIAKGKRVWFGVDRQILVNDMSAKLFSFDIDHGVIMAGHPNFRPQLPVQVVSFQTLEKRGWSDEIDLLIVDEAHANMRTSLLDFVKKSTHTKVAALTATPFHPGMGKVYEFVVNPTTTNKQIEEGFLVPLRVYTCEEADMTGAKTVGGEWSDAEVQSRGAKIVGDIVQTWHKKTLELFGKPEKTIVFSANVAHGAEIVKSFSECGFNFRQISYRDTDADARDELIREFRKPNSSIHGLVSCGVLTRGFDVTDVKIGIMARPLRKSFSEFIQQIGRIQRAHPGKEFGLLLDHAGNVGRFGDEMAELFEHGVKDLLNAPDAKPPRKDQNAEEKKQSFCPACNLQWRAGADTCLGCGHRRERRSMVEAVPGHMREVVIGKTKLADNHRHLYAQVVSYTRGCGNPATAKGRAAHLFKHIVGQFPDGYSYERTHNVPITRGVMNQIREKQIAFRAQQGAHA